MKAHGVALARKHGRPFQYLSTGLRKEDAARKLAERDGIEEGLVEDQKPEHPDDNFKVV